MAVTPSPISFSFRDSQGRTSRIRFYIQADGASATLNLQVTAGNFLTYFAAVSNASVSSGVGNPTDVAYGTNAQYASAQDKAVLMMETTKGSIARIQIPAPKAAIFYADGITVNPGQTNMATLIAYLVANWCNRDNVLITEYVAGFYQRRKLPRRVSSIVLSPKGDTPAQ